MVIPGKQSLPFTLAIFNSVTESQTPSTPYIALGYWRTHLHGSDSARYWKKYLMHSTLEMTC